MYREVIDKHIASAMKNGEQSKLTVWREIKTAFINFQKSGSKSELTDEKELQIITKMVQQRKDSIEQFTKAGREELAMAEQTEMNILQSLLPDSPTEEDIINSIDEFLANKTEKPTMKDMRDVMSFAKSKYPTVNGGEVSRIFREKYI